MHGPPLSCVHPHPACILTLSKNSEQIHRKLALEMVLEDQEATAAAAAASEEGEGATASSRKGGDGEAAGLVVGEVGAPSVEEGGVADKPAAAEPEEEGEREGVAGKEPKAWVVTKENLDKVTYFRFGSIWFGELTEYTLCVCCRR